MPASNFQPIKYDQITWSRMLIQIHILITNNADPDHWLLQEPTDLDLNCLQRQGISQFSRTRVKDKFTDFCVLCLWRVLERWRSNTVPSTSPELSLYYWNFHKLCTLTWDKYLTLCRLDNFACFFVFCGFFLSPCFSKKKRGYFYTPRQSGRPSVRLLCHTIAPRPFKLESSNFHRQ